MRTTDRFVAGFTLIELVIGILIIGIISAVAAPQMHHASQQAKVNSTVLQLVTIESVVTMHLAATGATPAEVSPGVTPSELQKNLRGIDFSETPIGGEFDWQGPGAQGFQVVGIGLRFPNKKAPLDTYAEIDSRLDDGDLKTGRIRQKNQGAHRYLLLEIEY